MRPASSSVKQLQRIGGSRAFHNRGGSLDCNMDNRNAALILGSIKSSSKSPFSKKSDKNYINLKKGVRKSSKDSKQTSSQGVLDTQHRSSSGPSNSKSRSPENKRLGDTQTDSHKMFMSRI
jgi:hypothetical protein